MPEIGENTATEVLILRNPIYHKVADPDAFEILIKSGAWLPLVFGTLRAVVERHFSELCELNWDYVNAETEVPENYFRYKSMYGKNLDEEQIKLVRMVADEIESELALAARQFLASQENSDNDE